MIDEGIKPFRWTAEGFYLALDAGAFIDRRVQLIDGEIIEMASMKNWHALGIKALDDFLSREFGSGYWVRVQMSIDLSPHSVPDPDISVIAGGYRSHRGPGNPTSALLLVEVSDTTLSYDRRVKKSLYAASGIADYWILDLVDNQLEVYRDPIPDTRTRFGWTYASRTDLHLGDSVSPLALPSASIAVADLLP